MGWVGVVQYIRSLQKLGIVSKLAERQLLVRYRDHGGNNQCEWMLKADLVYIAARSSMIPEEILISDMVKEVTLDKNKEKGE